MKKVIFIILIFVLVMSSAFAQEFNPRAKGDKAMLFGFSGLGFLGVLEYQGGFGYKMFMSDNTALRLGLVFNYDKDNLPYPENDGIIGEDGYDKTFGVGAEIAIEKHNSFGRVDPYFGFGGGFFMTTTEAADPVWGPTGSTLVQPTLKNEIGGGAGMNFGGFLILGMEYFLNDNLSLSGEYHFGVDFTSSLTQEFDNGTTKIETKGGSSLGFGITSTGLLTLAIYR